MKASVNMENNMSHLVDHLISISDFSKGKTSHIFDDVRNNNAEYVILKNNQPAAVLISVDDYKRTKQLEDFLEKIDNQMLFEQATDIQNNLDDSKMLSMKDIMAKYNIKAEDVENATESVEID